MATNSLEPCCRRIPPNESSKDRFACVCGADRVFLRPAGANSKGEPDGGPYGGFNRSLVSIIGEHFQFHLDGFTGPALKHPSTDSMGSGEGEEQSSDRRRIHRADVKRPEF